MRTRSPDLESDEIGHPYLGSLSTYDRLRDLPVLPEVAVLQIDVFISYGMGGSLAIAATRQLAQEPSPLSSPQALCLGTLTALVGGPTGLWMISRHTPWETMQVFADLGSVPSWLLVAFQVSMATQALLGFWVTNWLMQRGRPYLANLNWMAGLFLAGFIVMYGWDGLAWDRFLYDPEAAGGAPWQPGAGRQMGLGWILSPAARSLFAVTLLVLVPTLYVMRRWAVEGARSDDSRMRDPVPGAGTVTLRFFQLFGITLLMAAVSALTVHTVSRFSGHHLLSYFLGLPLSFLLAGAFLRSGGPVDRIARRFAPIDLDAS
jgi:hypothetical protein